MKNDVRRWLHGFARIWANNKSQQVTLYKMKSTTCTADYVEYERKLYPLVKKCFYRGVNPSHFVQTMERGWKGCLNKIRLSSSTRLHKLWQYVLPIYSSSNTSHILLPEPSDTQANLVIQLFASQFVPDFAGSTSVHLWHFVIFVKPG